MIVYFNFSDDDTSSLTDNTVEPSDDASEPADISSESADKGTMSDALGGWMITHYGLGVKELRNS